MKRLALFTLFALLSGVFCRNAQASSSLDEGLTAYYQKNWISAEDSFRKAMKEDPKNSLALIYTVVSSFWAGTSQRALQNTEDNLTDNPNDQMSQVRLGFMYYTKALVHGQKPEQALTAFRDAAKLGPSSLVHTGLGIVYFDIGNFPRAKKELARAMDMNANDVIPYEYMGRILLSFDDDPTSAANYFKQETTLMPNYPDGHYYYATALDSLGQSEEATAEYQKTIAIDPIGIGRGIDAKVALGDLYLRNKQYDEARQTFQDALKLTPNDPMIKQRLAQIDKEQKTKIKN